nr:hypothetical protein [Gammaproteobacteria bacterium]
FILCSLMAIASNLIGLKSAVTFSLLAVSLLSLSYGILLDSWRFSRTEHKQLRFLNSGPHPSAIKLAKPIETELELI